MQKLVIQTQYLENYGSSDDPYMKFKGGSTYVMPNCGDLNSNEIATIVTQFKPMALMTFESSNGGCDNYITDVSLLPHSEKVTEDWDSPIEFSHHKDTNTFCFIQVTDNRGEYGYMRSEILEKTETWYGASGGLKENYKAEYLMEDGDILLEDELKEWFETKEAA